MNIKRIIVLGMVLFLSISSYPASTVKASNGLTDNIIDETTVITRENVDEVVKYLGLSTDAIVGNDTGRIFNTITVGELKEIMKKSIVDNTSAPMPVKKKIMSTIPKLKSKLKGVALTSVKSGSVSMSETFDNDGYMLEISATGIYSGTEWTGIGGISADVDSDQLLIVYKIGNKNLQGEYTSTCITISGEVYVDAYVGIGDFALIKISSQKNSIKVNFYAKNYLK